MQKSTFRFKQFDCCHGGGSMKIGVDAVLIGAWADVAGTSKILDVGTGCGVIALMCAQRNQSAVIDAIDIHRASVEEASENFRNSPWTDRLSASFMDFNDIKDRQYDLIISNPPYFNSGLQNPSTSREMARHQSALSPKILLHHGVSLLTCDGSIAMVVPANQFYSLKETARELGIPVVSALWIKGNPNAPVKRVLFRASSSGCEIRDDEISTLILEMESGKPTDAHVALCKDFYLKF